MPAPRFSILTPVYDTPHDVLEAMLQSVRAQSYGDWELCLVDDCSPDPAIGEIIDRAAREDPRVRLRRRAENGGIVAASNDALEMAEGEYVALLDHDDELHPDALAQVDRALLEEPGADYVYTDEDKIDRTGRHSGPFFKPDWSPERMRTQMYTCHLSVFRRRAAEEVGGFDPEFEGSQDWDLVLKVTERGGTVLHVPRVLYHWRMLETSAAGGGEAAKPWAFEAGRRAVQAHCKRTGVSATVTRDESDPGVYHLEPALPQEPPVSIVIPTGGQVREVRYEKLVLVANCLESIVERTTYSNYEVICVLDDSTPDSVRDELSTLGGDRLQLVDFDRPFNFSGKINVGAARASGEHLVLLNDDIEVATPGWIERMVMYSMIPEVGAVGGRLLWEDGRIQHAGIRINDGLPGHPYYGFWREHRGYANAVRVAQDCMAVTGACLMTRRSLFEETGGLSEEFTVNYNDVDYCLSVWAGGRRVVYDPDLVMFHFESSSRSSDVHEWEKERLMEKWLPLTAVDPYTNPNLRYEVPKLTAQVRWAIGRWPRLRIPVRQPADRRRA